MKTVGRMAGARTQRIKTTGKERAMLKQREELKDRVEARRREWEAHLANLKADGRAEAREEIKKLETRLQEIQEKLKSGWDNLSEEASARINELLKT